MMALDRLVIQTGDSSLIFGDGIIQVRSNAYMHLGTDRSITYAHLEDANYTWRDMFLDLTQCALDIVGALPVPGVATAANLVNAGISLARGDYLGAAMSAGQAALSLLPGANTATAPAVAAKIATRAGKIGRAAGKVVQAARLLASGAENLNLLLSTAMAGCDVAAAILSGEFDLSDPDCRQDIAALFQGAGAGAKGKMENNRKKVRTERMAGKAGGKGSRKEPERRIRNSGIRRIRGKMNGRKDRIPRSLRITQISAVRMEIPSTW